MYTTAAEAVATINTTSPTELSQRQSLLHCICTFVIFFVAAFSPKLLEVETLNFVGA